MYANHRLNSISATFEWNPPASETAIRQAEADYGAPLPPNYIELLRRANCGSTDGNLVIIEVEDCVQRNLDYEVPEYMPGYFMIGDDGGGTAILINMNDRRIYECDMGVMDERFAELSANSLKELLTFGTTLLERDGQ